MNTSLLFKSFLALHIISIVCWFSVLFYLPRLFVYHREAMDKISRKRFIIMERRLYYGIGAPAAILTLLSGHFLLAQRMEYLHQTWMHIKLALVFILCLYHLSCGHYRKLFITNPTIRSSVFFRLFNEVPTLILIAVVCLVVFQP